MASSLKVGIVGCGKIHGTHAEALLKVKGAQLVAFHDLRYSLSEAAAVRYGVEAFEDYREFLRHCDLVHVCVPTGLHAEVGIAAANSGCHVLVEKPIEVSLSAAKRLIEACQVAGVKLGCISQHRCSRSIQRLRSAVQSGELGTVYTADAYVKWLRTQAYYDSGDWRGTWNLDGGGCLMNQGVHTVDMIQWIMGGARSVQAMTVTLGHRIEVEDVANLLVEYSSGAHGVIQASTCSYPGFAERFEVSGEKGTVVIEGDRVKLWAVDAESASAGMYGGGVMQQPTPNVHAWKAEALDLDSDPSSEWGEQHRLQIQDFVDSICEDRSPIVSGEDALEPLKLILAAYQSHREDGRRVMIEELS